MTEVFKLLGTIAIDASGVETTLNDTSEKTAVFSENVQKHFRNIAATAALVFSLDKLKDFGQGCIEAYADIAANEAAFTQIMGDYTDEATAKLQGLEAQTGVASYRMMNHFTMLTSRYLKHGYSMEEATDLAAQGMLVAADAAAMYNMSLDEAVGHLNSYINGSYEGGEAISLFARDTEMAQKAVAQGFITDPKQWADLKEGERQVVRLNDAVQQLADGKVTGQSLLESGSYQNQIANLTSHWQRFKAVIGEPLTEEVILPVVEKLVEFLKWCADNPDTLKNVFGKLGEGLSNTVGQVLDGFIKICKYLVEHEGALTATVTAIGLAFAGVALATHPILTALAAIVSFIMWLAGNDREDYLANIQETKPVAEQYAGKYAHWTDAQKDAALDYLYGADIQNDKWMAKASIAMQDAGLSDDDIRIYQEDVSAALRDGDYYITIEDTWFDEATETQMQGQLDEMGLEATVTMVPDYSQMQYSDVQAYIDSGGTYVPGYNADGSHASGLDRVPFDGYRAILHKDEAVLNAANAAVWRNGSGMGDTSRLEGMMQQLLGVMNQVVANTGRNQTVVLDSGVLVGQIAPKMDIQLGTFASKKGRGIG